MCQDIMMQKVVTWEQHMTVFLHFLWLTRLSAMLLLIAWPNEAA